MRFDEEKQKWIPETAEDQQFFEYAYNKGFAQAAKKQNVETDKNSSAEGQKTIDLDAIQQMINAALAPMSEQLAKTEALNKQNMIDKVVSRQQKKIPETYMTYVNGDTEQEIKASYDKAYEIYQSELKATGVVTDFGAPTPNKENAHKVIKKFSDMTPSERIELCKNDPQEYSRLKKENQ